MLKSFLFAVMVNRMSNGEMSFADFHLAIKWICDISQQHEDQWLLNHAARVVCQSLLFHLASKWLVVFFSG